MTKNIIEPLTAMDLYYILALLIIFSVSSASTSFTLIISELFFETSKQFSRPILSRISPSKLTS